MSSLDYNALLDVTLADTETDGLDGPVIELALVRWNVQHACIVSTWSSLVMHHQNRGESVNRIPADALDRGLLKSDIATRLCEELPKAPVILGWNIQYDRQGLEELVSVPLPFTWVDAMNVAWPLAKPYAPLYEVALANGVPIVQAHRALSDCLTLARLLERMAEQGINVRELLRKAAEPRRLYQGLQKFEDNQTAKDMGFWWEQGRKMWLRRATPSEVAALPFPCREVPP